MNESSPKKPRAPKSARFPFIELAFAIDVVKEARKFGRDMSDATLAGRSSVNSGAYIRKKAALGYYGLIVGRGSNISTTDLTERIAYPKNTQEERAAIQTAFCQPEIFGSLYNSLEKGDPISMDSISSLLVRDYGVGPSAVSKCVLTFVKSGIFAKLISYDHNDKSRIVLLESEEQEESDAIPPEEVGQISYIQTSKPKEQIDLIEQEAPQKLVLAVSAGTATITAPRELTDRDIERIKNAIDNMKM